MHRLLTLYPPPSDPEAFRAHFEGTHLPLVQKLPGLRGYSHGFDLTAADGGESPYFCTFAGDFDDARALDAALASSAGQAVGADVPNYATGGIVLLRYDVRDPTWRRTRAPVADIGSTLPALERLQQVGDVRLHGLLRRSALPATARRIARC